MRKLKTLNATVVIPGMDDDEIAMHGWLRGKHRSSTLEFEWSDLPKGRSRAAMKTDTVRVELGSFVQFDCSECLTWNCGDAKSAEYMNYASGKVEKVKFVEI